MNQQSWHKNATGFWKLDFFLFNYYLPLLGKLCAKEPVSSPPSCWADVALFISQLLCGFCEAVCEVSTSLLYMQARLHSPQMCGVSCGVLFLAHNKHVAAELCFCLSVLGVCSKQVRFQRRVLFSWIFCNKIAAQGDNMSMWKLPVCSICYILVSQIWRDLSSSWVIIQSETRDLVSVSWPSRMPTGTITKVSEPLVPCSPVSCGMFLLWDSRVLMSVLLCSFGSGSLCPCVGTLL